MSDGRTVVAEPEVKAALRALGVSVPNGVTAPDVPDASGLHAPLVLKAFGPGIVHKTELGAVWLGLDHAGVAAAVDGMRARLRSHDITPSGFLVEEQCRTEPGIELIAGVVRREPFGLVVALGLGGALHRAARRGRAARHAARRGRRGSPRGTSSPVPTRSPASAAVPRSTPARWWRS